jgi:hypothetical protein
MRLLLLCLLITPSLVIHAQPDPSKRYQIQLPAAWQKKPKLLLKLTEIIESHIPQLEGKEETLDTIADTKVEFGVLPAVRVHTFYHPSTSLNFTTVYTFYAYMDVRDKGVLVHRLILNDSTEQHTKAYKFYSRGNTTVPPVQQSIELIKARILPPVADGQRNYQVPDLAFRNNTIPGINAPIDDAAFIRGNGRGLTPTEGDLWDKVASIIMNFKVEDE